MLLKGYFTELFTRGERLFVFLGVPVRTRDTLKVHTLFLGRLSNKK